MTCISLNQKGIGIVAVILVLTALGAFGFVGLRVWQNQQTVPPQSNEAVVSEPASDKNSQSKGEVDAYKDWNKYANDSPDFSFRYPNNWEVDKTEASNTYVHIYVKSPDYKYKEPTELCGSVISGYQIDVSYNSKFANPNIVEEKLKAELPFVKNARLTKLGGLEAVRYSGTPGECGYLESTTTHYNGFDISVNGSLYKELGEYEDIYNKIVESFEL